MKTKQIYFTASKIAELVERDLPKLPHNNFLKVHDLSSNIYFKYFQKLTITQ